jgi:hypothetical protein
MESPDATAASIDPSADEAIDVQLLPLPAGEDCRIQVIPESVDE